MSQDELAEAALAGDRRAMEALACVLNRGLRRYFFRRRWAPDVVDDLVQLTFVAMLMGARGFETQGKQSFMRWVYGIAKVKDRAMRSENARATRSVTTLVDIDKTPARGLSSFIMLMESADMLDEAVKQLSPAQRQAVEKFLDKARGEDRSPNHPAVNLYRARKKLKRDITERMNGAVPPEPAAPESAGLAPEISTPPAT
jgi:DNA-directed RNA polymerase specialized sigma24 family protein